MTSAPQVLIIFATVSEAQATIRQTNATVVEGEKAHVWSEGHIPCCYRFDRGMIVISNVGLHSAQMSVAKYASFCDEIWNLGLAGALRADLPLGTITAIEKVGKYIPIEDGSLDPRSLECISFTLPHFFLASNGAHLNKTKLISSDFPVHDHEHRKRLSVLWDLVDMEGYGIAYAAAALGKKCYMWKIISDFASPGGREMIRKHKHELSEKIAETILSAL